MEEEIKRQLPFWHGAFMLADVLCMKWNENKKAMIIILNGMESTEAALSI